jgi:cytochrome P450
VVPKLPPGPREPALVQAIRFGRDPYRFLARGAARYGTVFTMRLPGDPPRVVISEPTLVRQVFAMKADEILASKGGIPVNLGEHTLLFLDGEAHRRDRQLLTPVLHGEQLKGYAQAMQRVTEDVLAELAPGQTIDLQELLQRITLEIILRCVFGVGDVQRLGRPVVEWLEGTFVPAAFFLGMLAGWKRVRDGLDRAVARALQDPVRGPRARLPWHKVGRAKAEVIAALRTDLERCRQHGTNGRSDILAMLADARYEDGTPMTIAHAIDELVTMLVGGHETTSNTLAWTLAHVLPRPDVLARIAEERRACFGDAAIDPSRCHELAYLDACIKESMRLTPIAPAVPRVLAHDYTLGLWRLPAGAILFPCTYVVHHRPDLWPEPERFEPQRFIGEDKVAADRYFPFGGGRRVCIGMAFARFEMRIVLTTLLARRTLRLERTETPHPIIRGLTVAPQQVSARVVA